jgi:di/tricarboxylate transporter
MTLDRESIVAAGLSSLGLATLLLGLAVNRSGSGPIAAMVAAVGLAACVALTAAIELDTEA